MSFVPLWLVFLGSGAALAVGTIYWAVKTRQFEEQDRARHLPLCGLEPDDYVRRTPLKSHRPSYAAAVMTLASGLAVLGAMVLLVLRG